MNNLENINNLNHNIFFLQDICLRQENCGPSKVETALTYVSYIGIVVSLACLMITIVTLVVFK